MCTHSLIWLPIGHWRAVPYHENPWLLLAVKIRGWTQRGRFLSSRLRLPSPSPFAGSPRILSLTNNFTAYFLGAPATIGILSSFISIYPPSLHFIFTHVYLSFVITHFYFSCIHSVHRSICPLACSGFSCCFSVVVLGFIIYSSALSF